MKQIFWDFMGNTTWRYLGSLKVFRSEYGIDPRFSSVITGGTLR